MNKKCKRRGANGNKASKILEIDNYRPSVASITSTNYLHRTDGAR